MRSVTTGSTMPSSSPASTMVGYMSLLLADAASGAVASSSVQSLDVEGVATALGAVFCGCFLCTWMF
jgi:hypothetical protein